MNQIIESSNANWPNFFIIGAAKAGTTALYSFLDKHPEIYMSKPKEPNFFLFYNDNPDFSDIKPDTELYQSSINLYNRIKKISVVNIKDYWQLFSNTENKTSIGEASPLYLSHPNCPALIKEYIPDAKLIMILRNPIDRAYSSYLHMVRTGNEAREFHDALSQEPIESENFWCSRGDYYIRPGFYARQLKLYFNLFDRKQIKIYLYDDFKNDPQHLICDLYRYLGVDDSFKQDLSVKKNVSGVPKNRFLYNLSTTTFRKICSSNLLLNIIKAIFPIKFLRNMKVVIFESSLKWPKISKADRDLLLEIYKSDILELQDLINRDLSAWISQ